MAVVNPAVAGGGFPSGSNGSANAITITGANDFVFAPNTFDVTTGITLAAQAAGTVNGSDQFLSSQKGVKVVVDITAITTATLTVTIQGKDLLSGKYYTMLASAALAATGTTVMTIYPGAAATANVSANDHLPTSWRVIAVVTGTSVTATVGASVLA